jgi:hypothetical protein
MFWETKIDQQGINKERKKKTREKSSSSSRRLTSSLSHLSTLASKTSHTLLSPFGTHATDHIKVHHHGVSILEAVRNITNQSHIVLGDSLDI